jgi:dihydrofolate reductase
MLSMVVAMAKGTGVIGLDGDMPWKLSADLRRFKEITTGGMVVMGRKTWESIPAKFRPLPDRRNVVLSRDLEYRAEGAEVFAEFSTVMQIPSFGEEWFVIGGESIYRAAMPYVQRLYVTWVDYDGPGDARFPTQDLDLFVRDRDFPEVRVETDEKNTHDSRFMVMRRQT